MKKTIRNFKETVEIQSSFFVRLRTSRYLPVAMLCAVVLGAACVHIWQRVHVLHLVAEVGALRQENNLLADDVRKVYSETSAMAMSSRIQTYAADSLGLKMVAADCMFTLVPQDEKPPAENQELSKVLASALNRIGEHIPQVSQTEATAGELRSPIIDSLANGGTD